MLCTPRRKSLQADVENVEGCRAAALTGAHAACQAGVCAKQHQDTALDDCVAQGIPNKAITDCIVCNESSPQKSSKKVLLTKVGAQGMKVVMSHSVGARLALGIERSVACRHVPGVCARLSAEAQSDMGSSGPALLNVWMCGCVVVVQAVAASASATLLLLNAARYRS